MQDSPASTGYQQQLSSEKSSSSAAPLGEVKGASESDDGIGRVSERGIQAGPSGSVLVIPEDPETSSGPSQRKRGGAPDEKEQRRLKRLLRNRVSAQQARERKKAYLSELETKVKVLEQKNSELEERVSTLQNENQMLRQILKNTTMQKGTER